VFIYPDAFDLSNFGSDRETPASQLKWTYEVIGENPPTTTYVINGATPLTGAEAAAGNLPTTPTLGGRSDLVIAGPGAVNSDTGEPMDNNPATITVRNQALSPFGNPVGADQAGSGIIAAQTKQVVFYVTDLNQFTASNPVFFYTSDDTDDYLSPNGEQQYNRDMHTTDGQFLFIPGEGLYSSSYDTVGGLCMGAALTSATPPEGLGSNNTCQWDSPYGVLQLVKNNVYRIRCDISGSMTGQATAGQRTPLWNLDVINFYYNPTTGAFAGLYAYIGETYFFDNVGGEQATWSYQVTSPSNWTTVADHKTYDYWWTPPAVSTTQWNDEREAGVDIAGPGPWAASASAQRNALVSWRILDVERNPGINAQNAQGTLCLNSITIDRFDLNNMRVVNTQANGLYNPAMTINLDAVSTGGALRFEGDPLATVVTTAGGGITLTPAGTGQGSAGNMLALVNPGDNTPMNVLSSTDVMKNYPVAMQAQKIYQVQFELSAPTQADANNPIDAFWIGADMVSNERIDMSMGTNMAYHHGMPNTTPQMFKSFFSSAFGTRLADPNASPTWWSTFRPRFMIANSPTFAGAELNSGAIKITQIRVDEVEFNTAP